MKIRDIESDEIALAEILIKKVFDEYVYAEYSEEGIGYFYTMISEESIRERFINGSHIFVAEIENEITGYIEIINSTHIYLLFVLNEFQGKGIAGKLINYCLKFLEEKNPDLKEVTVNSTSSALTFYEKLGFRKIADFQMKNGILSFPMCLRIK